MSVKLVKANIVQLCQLKQDDRANRDALSRTTKCKYKYCVRRNDVRRRKMSEEESHCKELLTQMYVRYTNLVTKTSLAEIQRETSNKRRVIFVDCNYLID